MKYNRFIYFSFFIATLFNGNNEHNQAPQNKANLQYENSKQFRKKNKIRKKPLQEKKQTNLIKMHNKNNKKLF